MKKLNRRGTAALVIALVLSILLIAFVSTLPRKFQIRQGREAAAEIFDPQNIDSFTLAFVYESRTPSPLSPAEYWPCARVTDPQAIETICTLLLDATREQVDYGQHFSAAGQTYWLLELNDSQQVRLLLGRSNRRQTSTAFCDGKYWDLDLPASQTLYDALAALTSPPKSEEIVSATLSTLEELRPTKTLELTGEAMETLHQAMDGFLTDTEQIRLQEQQITTIRAKATHRLDLCYADGTQVQLFYTPVVENNARIIATWQIGEYALGSTRACFQALAEKNPFPELFALLEN